MGTIRFEDNSGMLGSISITPDFRVGDPCPDGYVDRQEWFDVHLKAGLKQKRCEECGRYKFPHELSEKKYTYRANMRDGSVIEIAYVKCLDCEKKSSKQ